MNNNYNNRKQTREQFWQKEKYHDSVSGWGAVNPVLKQTKLDYQKKAPFKHPKQLYSECIKDSAHWHHYSSQENLEVDQLAMILCRDIGCQINYCSLGKMSLPSEHNKGDDCSSYIKVDKTIDMYDYIQKELANKRQTGKYKELFNSEMEQMRKDIQQNSKPGELIQQKHFEEKLVRNL